MEMNFKPLKYILRSSAQRFAAIHTIDNLPLEEDHPLEVLIQEHVEQRTLSQNSYYWMRLGEIAEQAWVEGKQYSTDAWHEYCKREVMPDWVKNKIGEMVFKKIKIPDGRNDNDKACFPAPTIIISTADLEKEWFAKYITAVEAFGSTELGVQFKANE